MDIKDFEFSVLCFIYINHKERRGKKATKKLCLMIHTENKKLPQLGRNLLRRLALSQKLT